MLKSLLPMNKNFKRMADDKNSRYDEVFILKTDALACIQF